MRAKKQAGKKSKSNKSAKTRKEVKPPERKQTKAQRTQTIKFLMLDETKKLFEWITDKRDKAIFLLAYRHGLRASEIGMLRVSDLDGFARKGKYVPISCARNVS